MSIYVVPPLKNKYDFFNHFVYLLILLIANLKKIKFFNPIIVAANLEGKHLQRFFKIMVLFIIFSHTQEQNGVIEQCHHTIRGLGLTMLCHDNMPTQF